MRRKQRPIRTAITPGRLYIVRLTTRPNGKEVTNRYTVKVRLIFSTGTSKAFAKVGIAGV